MRGFDKTQPGTLPDCRKQDPEVLSLRFAPPAPRPAAPKGRAPSCPPPRPGAPPAPPPRLPSPSPFPSSRPPLRCLRCRLVKPPAPRLPPPASRPKRCHRCRRGSWPRVATAGPKTRRTDVCNDEITVKMSFVRGKYGCCVMCRRLRSGVSGTLFTDRASRPRHRSTWRNQPYVCNRRVSLTCRTVACSFSSSFDRTATLVAVSLASRRYRTRSSSAVKLSRARMARNSQR